MNNVRSVQSPAYMIAEQFQRCVPDNERVESDLHRLALCGSSSLLEIALAEIKGDPTQLHLLNQRNHLGCTPLRLAATGGHLECVNILLEAGAHVDLEDVKGQTPLFVAVMNRHHECACRLLQCGACPEGNDKNSSTPLNTALISGQSPCVLILLEYGAHPDKLYHFTLLGRFTSSLCLAVDYMEEADLFPVMKALLMYGAYPDGEVYLKCYSKCPVAIDADFLYQLGVPLDMTEASLCRKQSHDLPYVMRIRHLKRNPRSLLSACRLVVLSCLPSPRGNMNSLEKLSLPSTVIAYLQYSEFSNMTLRTDLDVSEEEEIT